MTEVQIFLDKSRKVTKI